MLRLIHAGWFIRAAVCLALVASGAAADDVVYSNDFNGHVNSGFPEWLSSRLNAAKRRGLDGPPPITNA